MIASDANEIHEKQSEKTLSDIKDGGERKKVFPFDVMFLACFAIGISNERDKVKFKEGKFVFYGENLLNLIALLSCVTS